VVVAFERKFTNDGNGFFRFVDPQDGKVYTYTHLEPYNAHKVFPCFDQPDLKASYQIQAVVPPDWTVVTSVREADVIDQEDGRKLWIFPRSERFSTYVFSLHAGPYKVWQD